LPEETRTTPSPDEARRKRRPTGLHSAKCAGGGTLLTELLCAATGNQKTPPGRVTMGNPNYT
jgi:hypothetical protein